MDAPSWSNNMNNNKQAKGDEKKNKKKIAHHSTNKTSDQVLKKERENIILVEKANFSNFFSVVDSLGVRKSFVARHVPFSSAFFHTLFQHCLCCVCDILFFSYSFSVVLSGSLVVYTNKSCASIGIKPALSSFTVYFYTVVALLFNIILKFDVHFQIDKCLSKYLGLGTVNITAGSVQSCFVYKKLIKVLWKTWSKMILTWPNKRKKNLDSYE